ncbi:hypothetical protein GCM10010260_60000 [Streptomyces filipinensis]|uniref:Uncharacterized protein n=1 Tax=Streptomyces filipinensis TaxID=66887 RepID=A0A918IHC5_9ACTN|nr:hypothetical protein [Streptomyces filipinensis]GGV13071.1 hypothetical protein GCM10010260_60000 [Streptomyces filipinensis]
MTANEDLNRIRQAITGRPGPAPVAGGPGALTGKGGTPGAAGKDKKKGGPAPLPSRPAPLPPRPAPPPPPRSRDRGQGILGGIMFLVAAAVVIAGWTGSHALPPFGTHAPSWSSGSSAGAGAYPGVPPDDDSYSAPKELRVSPESGPAASTVTVSGSGFIHNGLVKLTFHATSMGEVESDGNGDFTARMRLPDPEFYGHFPGQTFSISSTEYTRDGTYQGNGPDARFRVG